MGKRSSFERIPRDYYPTPYEAVVPLLAHLPKRAYFIEPCAGDGRLIDHLEAAGHLCVNAYDIEPRREGILQLDARKHGGTWADYFITNPPWERETLHEIIAHLSDIRPTWLLFDADWMHTKQSAPFMPYCRKIVSVGRVKWIEDSPFTGKDNCAWYLFDQWPSWRRRNAPAQFIGRAA